MATKSDLPTTAEKAVDTAAGGIAAAPRAVAAVVEAAPLAVAAVAETVANALPARAAAKAAPAKRSVKPAAAKRAPAKRAAAKAVRPKTLTTKAKAALPATRKGKTVTDTVKTVTQQGEKLAAELKDRADGVLSKGKALLGDANDFTKGNLEALVESGKIAAKGLEKLGQDQAEYVRRSFEQTNAAFKGMAGVKSPTELMKLHSDYLRSSFDGLVAQTSHNTETMLKLAGEIAQPISNRFAVAAEKVKLAA